MGGKVNILIYCFSIDRPAYLNFIKILDGRIWEERTTEFKDEKTINSKGKLMKGDWTNLLEWYKMFGVGIFYIFRGDEVEKYTYINKGRSIIDYGVVNTHTWSNIEEFFSKDAIFSDHIPLEVKLKKKIVKNL